MINTYMDEFMMRQMTVLLEAGLEYKNITVEPDNVYGAFETQYVKIPAKSFYYEKEDALFRSSQEAAQYLRQLKIIEFFYSGLMSQYIKNNYQNDENIDGFSCADIQYALNVVGENPPIKILFKEDKETDIKEKDLNGYLRRYQLYKDCTIKKLQELSNIMNNIQ